MRKIFLLILALVMGAVAMAQNLEDVIYLKTGGVVRGTLIEQVPEVRMRTTSGDVMTILSDDIDHISQEVKANAGNVAGAEANIYSQRDLTVESVDASNRRASVGNLSGGIRLLTGATLQIRASEYECSAMSVDISLGKQFSPCLYLGAGISDEILLDYWYYGSMSDEPEPVAQMPVFAHVRWDARPGDRSLMADLRLGYSMTVDEYVDYSGIYINPAIGYRFGRVTASLGMELVKLNQPWDYSTYGIGGIIDEKTVNIQKSVQLRITLEWGGRN